MELKGGDEVKRDMDVVRQIIKKIAEHNEPALTNEKIEFDREVSLDELVYHFKIMEEAGLINGEMSFADNKLRYYSYSLSWYGNDFHDTFSNDNVWNKTKNFVKEKGMEVSKIPIDVFIELGKETIRKMLLGE